jgi:hypothetical protein
MELTINKDVAVNYINLTNSLLASQMRRDQVAINVTKEAINELFVTKQLFDPRKKLVIDYLSTKVGTTEVEALKLKGLIIEEMEFNQMHPLKEVLNFVKNAGCGYKVAKISKILNDGKEVEMNYVHNSIKKMVEGIEFLTPATLPSFLMYSNMVLDESELTNQKTLTHTFLTSAYDEISRRFEKHMWKITYAITGQMDLTVGKVKTSMADMVM